jgi:hypothetical protein
MICQFKLAMILSGVKKLTASDFCDVVVCNPDSIAILSPTIAISCEEEDGGNDEQRELHGDCGILNRWLEGVVGFLSCVSECGENLFGIMRKSV